MISLGVWFRVASDFMSLRRKIQPSSLGVVPIKWEEEKGMVQNNKLYEILGSNQIKFLVIICGFAEPDLQSVAKIASKRFLQHFPHTCPPFLLC